jgi:hypothetical protein
MKRRTVLIIVLILISFSVFSQDIILVNKDSKSYTDIGADIVSSYVWRGLQVDASPNIQGWGEFGNNFFNVGVWASSNFNGSYVEADVYAGFTIGGFNALLTDYFVGSDDFFNFDKNETTHVAEIALQYTISDNFPLQFTFGTLIFGDDKQIASVDLNDDPVFNNKNNFSSYIELMYTITHRNTEISCVAGGVTHESYFYSSEKASIINLGVTASKEIKITDNFSLPISFGLTVNPELESIYTVVGIML